MDLVNRSDMRVLYMTNGLMYVVELVDADKEKVQVKNAIAFMPNQNGMAVFEAFSFTLLSEVVTINLTTLIAMTSVGDDVVSTQYLEALKQARQRQSGLVMP